MTDGDKIRKVDAFALPAEQKLKPPDEQQQQLLEQQEQHFQVGQIIEGKYEIVSLLGRGGMGLVYRVKQILLNKELALKTIEKRCLNETVLRRFQQEAKTSFSLDHPNIIKVNDFGLLQDGSPFLVMELVNGETLAERIKRMGCLSVEETTSIFIQVCFGLAYAHDCGVVHRDIKPSNIMLLKNMPIGAEGSVKIVDFGIAKFTWHEGGEIQALTRTGEIFGSPLYMSPEQCSGSKVDQRSDVYSLGCVLFETLTGTPPFQAENALSTMMKHQLEPTPSMKEAALGLEFPPVLEQIVSRMLAKEPDQRYSSLGVLAHDLSALRKGAAISRVNSNAISAASKSANTNSISVSRNAFYAIIAATAVLFFAIGAGLTHLLETSNSSQRVTTEITNNTTNNTTTTTNMTTNMTTKKPTTASTITDILKDENQQSTMEFLQQLRQSAQPISELNISGRKISDEAIDLIAQMHDLKKIKMEESTIPNASMYKLNKLGLTHIDVSYTNINDEGVRGLSSSKTISDLKANATKLNENGIAELGKLKSLRVLSLKGVSMTNSAFAGLKRAKRLDSLDLTEASGLNAAGLKFLAKGNITDLNLTECNFSPSIVEAICDFKSLKKLRVAHTAVTADDMRKLLRSIQGIEYVDVSQCPKLAHTKELSELRAEFPHIRFDDERKTMIQRWN